MGRVSLSYRTLQKALKGYRIYKESKKLHSNVFIGNRAVSVPWRFHIQIQPHHTLGRATLQNFSFSIEHNGPGI